MSILTFVVATTITMTGAMPIGTPSSNSMKHTEFKSEVLQTILVKGDWPCVTPAADKQIASIKMSIEGTKVARVLSASCSN